MAEIRGIIVKKQGERAEVKVDKAESELTGLPKYIDCWNPVGAKAGDVVGAEYRDFDQRKAKLVIYGLPVLPADTVWLRSFIWMNCRLLPSVLFCGFW